MTSATKAAQKPASLFDRAIANKRVGPAPLAQAVHCRTVTLQYLDEVLRLLPFWPKERHLELAPKHWRATRDKLDADELAAPLGSFTIPAA